MKRFRLAGALGLMLLAFVTTTVAGCGGGSSSGNGNTEGSNPLTSWVLRWNQIAIDSSGIDHQAAGGGEQLGPTRASRAMAIVHIAIFDSVNIITPRYQSYLSHAPAEPGTSVKAAISQAAHDTLVALYPSQTARFDDFLAEDLLRIQDLPGIDSGLELGRRVAAAILADRSGDGSELSTAAADGAYQFSSEPGHWRKDPLNPEQNPHGTMWPEVRPFVIANSAQFRPPPPPALSSVEYAEAFAEAYRLGGDGIVTPTERTAEQTEIGIFWAYDGTPSLCAPPRLYNQVAVRIAEIQGTTDVLELARLLALVNVTLADAGIAVWEAKYHYDFWRPVTAIREADAGTGPSGLGDGNSLTFGDPQFTPLGAPASNLAGRDFTPPFPTYPSGHAGFGGALFQVLRNFYGTDEIAFSFVSDEFNGTTVDHNGDARARVERSYGSLSEAEEENGQSRIYLGIHFSFDKTEAITLGRNVGQFVGENIFQPSPIGDAS